MLIKGIVHQLTGLYTFQQNGVAKRKHIHILELVKYLKFQSSLLDKFWGDCVLTACYIINLLPYYVLKFQTPYQWLHGTIPNVSHLKVLGCLSYAKNMTPGTKFDLRSSPGVLIGYSSVQKGYKVYDLKTKSIYVSRKIIFYEAIFPLCLKR